MEPLSALHHWETLNPANPDFPVHIALCEQKTPGPVFQRHWHEQIQLLRFRQGEAAIHCRAGVLTARPDQLFLINANELHYSEAVTVPLAYSIINFDFSYLLGSQSDLCQAKYLAPLIQNKLLFQNDISQNPCLLEHVDAIIAEYREQEIGFELAIKASLSSLLVALLRHHVQKSLTDTEQLRQINALDHLRPVMEYIHQHYIQRITLAEMAAMAGMSRHHFCRLFKKTTGTSLVEYINTLRLAKAASLLSENRLNITEVALATGFNDINYFSRLFKKHRHMTPSQMRR